MSTRNLPAISVIEGIPTPIEERDKAYAVWAWECGRDGQKTADRLGIHVNTIYRWAKQDGWQLRYQEDRATLHPSSSRNVVAWSLLNTGPAAAAYIDDVIAGRVPSDKVRANVALQVLAMLGFAPISLPHPTIPDHAQHSAAVRDPHDTLTSPRDSPDHAPTYTGPLTREQAAAMTPDQRQAWEAARRTR